MERDSERGEQKGEKGRYSDLLPILLFSNAFLFLSCSSSFPTLFHNHSMRQAELTTFRTEKAEMQVKFAEALKSAMRRAASEASADLEGQWLVRLEEKRTLNVHC